MWYFIFIGGMEYFGEVHRSSSPLRHSRLFGFYGNGEEVCKEMLYLEGLLASKNSLDLRRRQLPLEKGGGEGRSASLKWNSVKSYLS